MVTKSGHLCMGAQRVLKLHGLKNNSHLFHTSVYMQYNHSLFLNLKIVKKYWTVYYFEIIIN